MTDRLLVTVFLPTHVIPEDAVLREMVGQTIDVSVGDLAAHGVVATAEADHEHGGVSIGLAVPTDSAFAIAVAQPPTHVSFTP